MKQTHFSCLYSWPYSDFIAIAEGYNVDGLINQNLCSNAHIAADAVPVHLSNSLSTVPSLMNKIRFSDRWIFAVHQTGGSGELGCNPSPNLQNNVDWTVKLPRCLQKSNKGENQLYCSMACLKSALLVMDLRAEPPSHQPKTNCPQ